MKNSNIPNKFDYIIVSVTCKGTHKEFIIESKGNEGFEIITYISVLNKLVKSNYSVMYIGAVRDENSLAYEAENIGNLVDAAHYLSNFTLTKEMITTSIEVVKEYYTGVYHFPTEALSITIDHSSVEFIHTDSMIPFFRFAKKDFVRRLKNDGFDADIASNGCIFVRNAAAEFKDDGTLLISGIIVVEKEVEHKKTIELLYKL